MSYLLVVYLFDHRLGDLALVEGRLQFSYSAVNAGQNPQKNA